jgi:Tfp pilus assembly protein PilF
VAFLVALFALGPAAAEEAKPAPEKASADRARAAVETLGRADDEAARRDLYGAGAAALGPLAAALESDSTDPAAWTRLAETFEGILRARLQDAEARLARLEHEDAEKGTRILPAEALKELEETIATLEGEIGPAGLAAARELAREGSARDEASLAVRRRLFQDVVGKLSAEIAAGDEAARAHTAARLARLGPLAAPLLVALARGDDEAARAVAERACNEATARYEPLLSAESQAARDFAAESFYGLGELVRPALERLAREGTPDERHRAARLLDRIDWSISEELYRRTGRLLDGFAALPWRERRMIAYELEKQGGSEAVPTLRRIVERDPSDAVKAVAAESLARLGDPYGLAVLARLGQRPLAQSPEVAAAIAMDQGIRYLQIRKFDRAIAEFRRVLEVQPENDVALYNLACAYALSGDKDRAYEYIERSIAAGFEDADHMEKDDDLKSLREDERFRKILYELRLKKRTEGARNR